MGKSKDTGFVMRGIHDFQVDPNVINMPLTLDQLEEQIKETNNKLATSYMQLALSLGVNKVAERHLKMALAAQNL